MIWWLYYEQIVFISNSVEAQVSRMKSYIQVIQFMFLNYWIIDHSFFTQECLGIGQVKLKQNMYLFHYYLCLV